MEVARTPSLGAVVDAVEREYDLSVVSCTPLDLGHDSASWSWRVETETDHWFLKARAGSDAPRGALVTAYLERHDVAGIVGPVAARGGLPYGSAGGFTLILFPFLDAMQAARSGLTPEGWRTLGALVRGFHDLPSPSADELVLPHETFTPWRRDLIEPLTELVERGSGDAIMRRFSSSWRAHRREIETLVAETDARANGFRTRSHAEVFCHTDIHTWNVLVSPDARLWIVDWDEAMLAPRERDLMFVTGGGLRRDLVPDDATAAFLDGYGDTDLDRGLLDYYRIARAVEDIAARGEEIALTAGATDAVREDSLRFFEVLFEPGENVELALAAIRP
jgi:spectinomycin phosphotransferase